MQAYQIMPAAEMFNTQGVTLNFSIRSIVSKPGMRVNCDVCGEEIMNGREVHQNSKTLCHPYARGAYYCAAKNSILPCAVKHEAVL